MIFTDEERGYLQKLRKRNGANHLKNHTSPLTCPITPEEEEMRSKIVAICITCIHSICLAQVCGIFPDEGIKKKGSDTIQKIFERIRWSLLFECS